ncbi:MAG: hypothetical protein ACR2G6_10865 [Gemmatimonadaceae bacterium]
MMRVRMIASAAALGLVAMASTAGAQDSDMSRSGVQFGIMGGAAFATGDGSESLGTGYNITGALGFNPAMFPFGMRLDVGYTSLPFDTDDLGLEGDVKIIGSWLNAILKFPATSVSPYILAAPGFANIKADVENLDSESETKFAAQFGGGVMVNLAGMATNLEAKYVTVFTEGERSNFVPITVGILFGGGRTR